MTFANAVNMCGVWASEPQDRDTLVDLRVWNESVAGTQFFESGDAAEVSRWSCAASDECSMFRKMIQAYRESRLRDIGADGGDVEGRVAFLKSLAALA